MASLKPNPIAWVQYQLRGGRKFILGWSALASALMIGLYLLNFNQQLGSDSQRIFRELAQVLAVFEFAIPLVLGTLRISNAVRLDFSGGMIESHRLMPLSAPRAIIGYILGAGSEAIAVALVIAIGSLIALIGGDEWFSNWLLTTLMFILSTLLIWTVAALFASFSKAGGAVVLIAAVIGITLNRMIWSSLPGMVVLVGPILRCLSEQRRLISWDQHVLVAIAGLVSLASLFFVGAVRKYRRSDQTALGIIPALLVVAIWIALSSIGMVWARSDTPLGRLQDQAMMSFVVGMMLSLIPTCNGARAWANARAAEREGISPRHPPLLSLLIPPVAVSLIIALMCGALPQVDSEVRRNLALIELIVLAFELSVAFLAASVYQASESAKIFVGIWVVFFCAGPPLVDAMSNRLETVITSISPINAIYRVLSNTGPYMTGLTIIWGLTIAMALLCYSSAKMRKAPIDLPSQA